MSAATGPESFRATWHMEAKRRLDEVVQLIEANADQDWEAEAHGHACSAWRLFEDNGEDRAAAVSEETP